MYNIHASYDRYPEDAESLRDIEMFLPAIKYFDL
jgi:hypothetical protein